MFNQNVLAILSGPLFRRIFALLGFDAEPIAIELGMPESRRKEALEENRNRLLVRTFLAGRTPDDEGTAKERLFDMLTRLLVEGAEKNGELFKFELALQGLQALLAAGFATEEEAAAVCTAANEILRVGELLSLLRKKTLHSEVLRRPMNN